jgi:glycerol-3-phosphate dehydrogenase (NAD(P)+)
VAALVAKNAPATLWARRSELAKEITVDHVNGSYLAGLQLPERLCATASLEEAVVGADVVVMGVPSHGFREVITELAQHLATTTPVVSLAKGIEEQSLKRMTEIVREVAPGSSRPVGVLTGPNLAREILTGHPAASVVAMADDAVAEELQRLFSGDVFRVYTNPDVTGCEIAGALKNVMAIAAGMIQGMGFGDNTLAAVITRGLAELTRLGIAMGGDPLTFSGLAGMGDLVATCISRQSRNRYVGEALGQGRSIDEIVAEMRMVAEGVKTSGPVVELANRYQVEMPIAEQVAAVIRGDKTVPEALAALMQRRVTTELYGIRG